LYRAFNISNILYKKDAEENINGGFKMKPGISIEDNFAQILSLHYNSIVATPLAS
jgi:hypothetical protein